jgi:hypothetical protein
VASANSNGGAFGTGGSDSITLPQPKALPITKNSRGSFGVNPNSVGVNPSLEIAGFLGLQCPENPECPSAQFNNNIYYAN